MVVGTLNFNEMKGIHLTLSKRHLCKNKFLTRVHELVKWCFQSLILSSCLDMWPLFGQSQMPSIHFTKNEGSN